MRDLLELVLHAHGGLDAWRQVIRIDTRVTLGGSLLDIKARPDGLRSAFVQFDIRRPRTVISPFPEKWKRGVYGDGAVAIFSDAGEKLEEHHAPRAAYRAHTHSTPWSDLEYLYFMGYAFWNYITTPFLFTYEGVNAIETEPWEEDGEVWRVLQVTFPSTMDTHCKTQRFYFDHRGMLKRHDYFTDAVNGDIAHYAYDPRTFDGFVFPTRRRAVSRGERDHAETSGDSIVWFELESVVLTTRDRSIAGNGSFLRSRTEH
jgi:hypothetical protein